MGPLQHDRQVSTVQASSARRPRRRQCLLKRCEVRFAPVHALSRYCSEACRKAACRWSRWRAARRYRSTEAGRRVRREQARRYRERVRERQQHTSETASAGPDDACEGHQYQTDSKKIACSRPGCYELFAAQSRSPLKKFCTALCRQALRRVLRREAVWLRPCCRLSREDVPWPPGGR